MDIKAQPEKAFALVVGIEKYEAGPQWNLDGPANDACRFVNRLREWRVPAENIFLFISPLDTNHEVIGQTDVTIQQATREPIYKTLTEILPKKSGDLLFLFWGGHGVMTIDDKRRLFYANATQSSKLNLDLNSLLRKLKSDHFSGLKQQICFVDACANYLKDTQIGSLPEGDFSHGIPSVHHQQFVFLAAGEGEYAKNVSVEQSGLFSKVLFEHLQQASWLPDFTDLAWRVQNRFNSLRASGLTKQTPTYLWCRDWVGNQITMGTNPPLVGSETKISPIGRSQKLSFKQKADLANTLLACSVMSNYERRQNVVNQLSPNIANTVPHSNIAKDHVMSLIDRCTDFVDGLEQLIRIVQYYEDVESQSINTLIITTQKVIPDLKLS